MPPKERWVFSIQRGRKILYEATINNLSNPEEVHKAYARLMNLQREKVISFQDYFIIIREINRLTGLSPKGARDLASKL